MIYRVLLLAALLLACGCNDYGKQNKEGYDAALIEAPPEACPYQPGEYGEPSKRKAWLEGWNKGWREIKSRERR